MTAPQTPAPLPPEIEEALYRYERAMHDYECHAIEEAEVDAAESHLRALIAALAEDAKRVESIGRDVTRSGRKHVDETLREFGYDSMVFAEARAVWHEMVFSMAPHVGDVRVREWLHAAAAIDQVREATT